MPYVSAIITTQNRSHLIIRAISCVLNQSYKDFELIVIDDASEDNTNEILKEYEKNKLIKTFRISRSEGANFARNKGLEISKGELIAFLDDDDIWLPRKLECQVKVLTNHKNVSLVGCHYYKNGIIKKLPIEIPYSALLVDNVIGGFSMCMFRRKDAFEVGCMDTSLKNAQDWDMWIKIAACGKVICYPECLAEYSTCELKRITRKENSKIHYKNYLKVVNRHKDEMNVLTKYKHKCVYRYHMTPGSERFKKYFNGGIYWIIRMMNQIYLYILYMKGILIKKKSIRRYWMVANSNK